MADFSAQCPQCGGKMAVGNKFCRRDCHNLHYNFPTDVPVKIVMQQTNQTELITEDLQE